MRSKVFWQVVHVRACRLSLIVLAYKMQIMTFCSFVLSLSQVIITTTTTTAVIIIIIIIIVLKFY